MIKLYIPHGSDKTQSPPFFLHLKVSLYIPHGSDKTRRMQHLKKLNLILYIPHGSDKTISTAPLYAEASCLYIPHGSDKTPNAVNALQYFISFISHMVQIKHDKIGPKSLPNEALYPTWFR